MKSSFYEHFRIRPIINARGYTTRTGGAALPVEVLDAMREASQRCVRMEDLQESASEVISRATGAEAGIVTSGASAALTLAAAAAIAGMDPVKMNRLPDTAGMKNEIVVQRAHRNDYDHALLIAGARFVECGFVAYTFPYDVEATITPRTAALFYVTRPSAGAVPLEEFLAIAHRHGLPVIVDAAADLPPAANLRRYIEMGADLVAFSGGKHLRGPQASGILCGRRELVASAALQHQDMDVFPHTWTYRHWIQEGKIAGPPYHGIGRGFKAGKEEIAGLMTALELYATRDFDAERRGWQASLEHIAQGLAGVPGIEALLHAARPNGQPVPYLELRVDPYRARMTAVELVNALAAGTTPVIVNETLAESGVILIRPEALLAGEPQSIVEAVRREIS